MSVFCRAFLFLVRNWPQAIPPKLLSVEVTRTTSRNVFQIKIYYYPDFSNLRMETKSEMTRWLCTSSSSLPFKHITTSTWPKWRPTQAQNGYGQYVVVIDNVLFAISGLSNCTVSTYRVFLQCTMCTLFSLMPLYLLWPCIRYQGGRSCAGARVAPAKKFGLGQKF